MWPAERGRLLPELNYLTSELVVPTISGGRSGGGPAAWGIRAHLGRLMQEVMDDSAPALEPLGLSPKAFFLLATVEEHPFPAELARAMHLPPPTVTYLVKQLEA